MIINTRRSSNSAIRIREGESTPEQISLMLVNLPLDITFVDENDKVKFYFVSKDRIFPRSPEIIGRSVQNCHPHKSVHIVEENIRRFKEKTKDRGEFWIQREGLFVHIRYFPVYHGKGDYKGTIEVSQEMSAIRTLDGERRILDWKQE